MMKKDDMVLMSKDATVEPVAPPDKAAVMNLAHHLTQVAAQAGLIVTIERLPLKPLAMGNCCYEIATYPMRGAQ